METDSCFSCAECNCVMCYSVPSRMEARQWHSEYQRGCDLFGCLCKVHYVQLGPGMSTEESLSKYFGEKYLFVFFFKNISQISHHEVGNSKWDTSRLVRCQGSRLVTAAFTAYSSLFLSPSVLLHIIGNTYCVSNFINSSPQIIPDPSGKLKYFDKLNWFLFPSSQSVKSSTYWKNK